MAWVVKRAKLNFKKVFFWNTLITSSNDPALIPRKKLRTATDSRYMYFSRRYNDHKTSKMSEKQSLQYSNFFDICNPAFDEKHLH